MRKLPFPLISVHARFMRFFSSNHSIRNYILLCNRPNNLNKMICTSSYKIYVILIKFLDYFQAVPILVEGSSQTELKHPKNVYTQYEPRVFTDDEVATIWESDEMKKFMIKVNFFQSLSIQLHI